MTKAYNYARIINTTKRLIDRFGATVTVVSTVIVPNPQGWKPPTESSQSVDLNAVSTDYEEKYIDGTVIKRGDKKFLIAAKGVELDPDLKGWIVDSTGVKWAVIKIETLVPGSSKILYKVQVRR